MNFDDTTHEKEQLLECIQTALTNKNFELECIIGNEKTNSRNTRVDFINVIKRIKGKAPFLKESQQDSLVIQLPNNSEYSKDISRITLNGGIISQYCANESLTPIINRVKFEKKSRIKDDTAKQVKIQSYGIRFNLKEEQQIAPEHHTVRELVKNWSSVDKSFRRKKTYSFLHENGEFRIDLSLVSFVERREKVGYVLDNNLSRFVVKPADVREPFAQWWSAVSTNRSNIVVLANIDKYYKDLRSSHIMEARDYTYEIEVEWLGNKLVHDFVSQSERREYIDSTLSAYTSIITMILQAIQGTFFVMNINEKMTIYNELSKLLGDEPRKFFPQAMDLKMENISSLTEEEHRRANQINIRTDYMVTEKADGIRTLLYIGKGGQCYLIAANGKILDIGLILPDYAHSVFDGEYITKGHRGDFCQNIYLFDAYIVKHENITKQSFIDGRYKHLFAVTKYYGDSSDVLIRDPKYSVRVFKKEYLSGDMLQATVQQSQSQPHSQPNSFNKIFDACRQILQKVNVKYGGLLKGEGHLFTYAIDGLIFIPAKLGVAQNFPGEIVKNISGRWASNLKWKPAIHTTIDFKVRFNKEVGTNRPLVIYHDEMRFTDATLFIKLYMNDNEMRRYMALKLLNEGDTPDYYPEDYPFNPVYPTLVDRVADGTPVNMASVIRLPIDKNNTTKCENGDIIEDGMIIECRYEREASVGFQWIPTRVRSDKTAANAANTVLTTWNLINNPITLDMVTTNGMQSADSSTTTDIGYFYYKGALMNEGDFESKPMNHFNNFVKSIILERGLKHKQKARVLDLGCGKLGDLIKYARLHVDTLVGIDVAPDNLVNRDDGAAVRALQLNLQHGHHFDPKIQQLSKKTLLILGNLNKNLMDGSAAADSLNKYYLDVLYGRYKPVGRGKLETMYGVGINQFHLALSSFTIHYFLSNQDDCHQFLLNIQENLKDQGYFIVFCLDGKEVLKSLGHKRKINGRNVWSIEVPESQEIPLTFDKSPFGQKIISYTDKFFRPTEENLVDCDFLEQECMKYELKLIDSKLFNDEVDNLYSEYQMVRPDTWKELEAKPYLKEWLSFHRWMMFQKVDGLNQKPPM
jgi:hypothetical protein